VCIWDRLEHIACAQAGQRFRIFSSASVHLLSSGSSPECNAGAQVPAARYETAHTIRIGGDGRWDFLETDAANRKLFVALESRVIVLDLETERVEYTGRGHRARHLRFGGELRVGPLLIRLYHSLVMIVSKSAFAYISGTRWFAGTESADRH
jgi:hypothetical protein